MSTLSFWRTYRRHFVCYLFVVAAVCFSIVQTKSVPKEPPIFPNIILAETVEVENNLQKKAERVLKGFGESEPLVVLTVEMQSGYLHRESFDVDPERTAIESAQSTEESLDGSEGEKLIVSSLAADAKSGDKRYCNRKEAVNRLVSQSVTKFESRTPQIKKVSCMIQVSEKNKSRLPEIEQAVWVALGLNAQRTDIVKAFVE